MTDVGSWGTVVLSGLEDDIRSIRLTRGIVLCAAAALVAGACGSAEPTTTNTAPTATATSTVAPTTTTKPEPTSTIVAATTTRAPTTTAAVAADRILPVPEHAAPTIDGVIADGEWGGATETTMTDGSTLHWMRGGETLYVALHGDSVGAVNLTIATGDRIRILHSSAALGSVTYTAVDGAWALAQDFDWCCRSRNDESARLALLDEEGWQANIGFSGDPGTVEYEVTLAWIDGATAVSYQTEAGDAAFWPSNLSPMAREQLIGPFPNESAFQLAEWARLEPTDS